MSTNMEKNTAGPITNNNDIAERNNLKEATPQHGRISSKKKAPFFVSRLIYVFVMIILLGVLQWNMGRFDHQKPFPTNVFQAAAEGLDGEQVLNNSSASALKVRKKNATKSVYLDDLSRDTKVYIWAVPDRSGTVIQRMLVAHAWAFAHNLTFLGTCLSDNLRRYPTQDRIDESKALLRSLGWEEILPFKCPPPGTKESSKEFYRLKMKGLIITGDNKVERRTPAWLEYIRSRTIYPLMEDKERRQQKLAVIHIRRGDLDFCIEEHARNRYLPNWYFKKLVKHYVPQDHDIVIYSEENSTEPWSDFVHDGERKYDLRLSTPLMEAWHAFMSADLFIDSRSHFSAVPALLNRHGTIIHTPKHSYRPLPQWIVVKEALWKRAVEWNLKQYNKCNDTEKLPLLMDPSIHGRRALF